MSELASRAAPPALTSSVEARRDYGRAHRADVPLADHAMLVVPPDRADPVDVLVRQDESRVQDLVPIRHARMNVSPFTFYRGSAALMAADLSRVPRTSLDVQLCGDAHVSNFGLFKGPDRRLVFDLNDFDETLPGPFEWDVKRLAASVTLAGRENGLSVRDTRDATVAATAGYRTQMTRLAQADPLEVFYRRVEFDDVLALTRKRDLKNLDKAGRKARARTSLRAFDKLTTIADGRRRIVDDPPLIFHFDIASGAEASVRAFFHEYLATLPPDRQRVLRRYELVDIAAKVVGVGSVGTRCLLALAVTADDQPLLLQFKEATASVLEPYLGASAFSEAGERVVQGQRLMQAAGDLFLGWARYSPPDTGRAVDFYVRQLWDGKGGADIARMAGTTLKDYAGLCGATLAIAHARGGDAAAIAGYLGDDAEFDRAVADFAASYADLAERDHAAHAHAIGSGRVRAETDAR